MNANIDESSLPPPPAIDGCTCICHRESGIYHLVACCGPPKEYNIDIRYYDENNGLRIANPRMGTIFTAWVPKEEYDDEMKSNDALLVHVHTLHNRLVEQVKENNTLKEAARMGEYTYATMQAERAQALVELGSARREVEDLKKRNAELQNQLNQRTCLTSPFPCGCKDGECCMENLPPNTAMALGGAYCKKAENKL